MSVLQPVDQGSGNLEAAGNSEAAAPEASSEKSQETTPQYVTVDVMEGAIAKAVETALARANQSSKDRVRMVSDAVSSLEKKLLALNVNITPEMKAQMRAQVETEMDEQTSGQDQPADKTALAQQVYDVTQAIFKEEQVTITQSDPEWKTIQDALQDREGNLLKYQRAVLRAVQAKRTRLEVEDDTAEARVGAGQERTTGSGAPMTPKDKIAAGLKKTKWQQGGPKASQ